MWGSEVGQRSSRLTPRELVVFSAATSATRRAPGTSGSGSPARRGSGTPRAVRTRDRCGARCLVRHHPLTLSLPLWAYWSSFAGRIGSLARSVGLLSALASRQPACGQASRLDSGQVADATRSPPEDACATIFAAALAVAPRANLRDRSARAPLSSLGAPVQGYRGGCESGAGRAVRGRSK